MPAQSVSPRDRMAGAGSGNHNHPARPPWRHYWPSGALALAGLIATAIAGWQMDRWTQARDKELFTSEGRLILGMIQLKMERYETALGRLRDACALDNGEISAPNWDGWLTHTLGFSIHYPNAAYVVVAPRITQEQRADFEKRAAAQVSGYTGEIATSRTNADVWFPVWRRWTSRRIFGPCPALGDDLLAETPQHPSFDAALSATTGWVTDRPVRLLSQKEGTHVGFWFVVPLRPFEFKTPIPWRNPDEPPERATQRRSQQRASYATGLLAAFLGGELFLNEFNGADSKVWVQLFTGKKPSPDTLLNPGHALPLHPRFTTDAHMSWYGRPWTARVASTPLFEAASLGYRATVVWGAGLALTLAVAAVAAWQTRGRWREASLAAQLRESLGRQERLSRDLHDGTLQSVYGVGLSLQRAQRQLDTRPADAPRQLTETANALQRVIGELRGFIRETDPGAREEVLLGEALAGVVEHQRHSTEMALELQAPPEADRGLNAAQSLELLNIAREALSNSIRHSGGRRVQLILDQAPGVLRLQVVDDGCGFNPSAAQSKGHGLRNLAARVRELGGTHRWESAAGEGCRLIVEVPLPSATGGSAA